MTHNDLEAAILMTFPGVEKVSSSVPQPGTCRVSIEPDEREDEIIEWLTVGEGSQLGPAGTVFEGRCSVATSLNIEKGVTIVAGYPNTGKTTVLIGLAEELHADGRQVAFLAAEDPVSLVAERFQPMFELGTASKVEDVTTLLEATPRGDAVMVDSFDQIITADQHQKYGAKTRALVESLHAIHDRALEKGVYVVVTITAKRPLRGQSDNVVVSNGIRHSFPIISVQGQG